MKLLNHCRSGTLVQGHHACPSYHQRHKKHCHCEGCFNWYFEDDSIHLDPAKTVPYCQRLVAHHLYTGCVASERWGKTMKEGKVNETPQYHSAFFGPAIQPTLQTACRCVCSVSFDLSSTMSARSSIVQSHIQLFSRSQI